MTPQEFARSLQKKADLLEKEIMAAERQTLTEARAEAIKLSSGRLTATDLARAGHPFARRAPDAAYDPSVINARTGLFKRSWIGILPRVIGGKIVTRLKNFSPEAKYMAGTKFMVPRTVGAEVKKRVQPRRLRRLRAAVKRALKG
jgi:hypothetical protein